MPVRFARFLTNGIHSVAVKLPSLVALALLLFGVLTFSASMWQNARGAAPILIKRGIVPGLAGDSAPGTSPAPSAAPTNTATGPTPTPQPYGSPLLAVRIDMVANELAYSASGAVVPVTVKALVEGPVPAGPALSYLSGAIVEAHPADLCRWNPDFAQTALNMTASRQTSLLPPKQEIVISFDGPRWHFNVACPGKDIRVPAFAEESLPGWLGLISGGGAPNGVAVEIPSFSGSPDCLHNRGVVRGMNAWGAFTIVVDIYTPPCTVPPP